MGRKDDLAVDLIGPPNSGKSSLHVRLTGASRLPALMPANNADLAADEAADQTATSRMASSRTFLETPRFFSARARRSTASGA